MGALDDIPPSMLGVVVFRALRVMVAAVVASAVVVPIGAGVAHAAPLDLVCAGTQHITFSPGLTLIPGLKSMTTNTIYAPCVSASAPLVTAGANASAFQAPASCVDLPDIGSGTRTLTWNTGQTSTYNFISTTTHVGGNTVLTRTGAVTAGLFAGDTAVEVIVGPTVNLLNCLAPPGITEKFDVVTLTFA
ncbi:MAG: hypothetical protein WBA97_32485 [Actinophytocola sp.]|uniref:hypothetical protein n=1 Tax=Actinophytocola sp. TaxID=1872138 RepID=UPI003C783770